VPGGAPKIRDFGGTANALESVTMDGRKHDRMNYRLSRTSTHIGDAFVVSSTIVRQVRADNLKSENERQGNHGSLSASLQTCQSRIPAGAASDDSLHLPMNKGIIRNAIITTLALALQYRLSLRETEPKSEPPTERNTPAIV